MERPRLRAVADARYRSRLDDKDCRSERRSHSTLADLKIRTLALGSRDSGHAAILPVHFLEQQDMREGRDYRALALTATWANMAIPGPAKWKWCAPSSTGGPTPAQSAAPSGATVRSERWCPKAACVRYGPRAIQPLHVHGGPHLDPQRERRFVEALSAMSYDNPIIARYSTPERASAWLPPHVDGYDALRQAAAQQGFFEQELAKSA